MKHQPKFHEVSTYILSYPSALGGAFDWSRSAVDTLTLSPSFPITFSAREDGSRAKSVLALSATKLRARADLPIHPERLYPEKGAEQYDRSDLYIRLISLLQRAVVSVPVHAGAPCAVMQESAPIVTLLDPSPQYCPC